MVKIVLPLRPCLLKREYTSYLLNELCGIYPGLKFTRTEIVYKITTSVIPLWTVSKLTFIRIIQFTQEELGKVSKCIHICCEFTLVTGFTLRPRLHEVDLFGKF